MWKKEDKDGVEEKKEGGRSREEVEKKKIHTPELGLEVSKRIKMAS